MLKLRVNPLVVTDLKEIRDYIAEDNAEYAEKIIKEIYGKFVNIQMFSEIGAELLKRVSFRTDYKYTGGDTILNVLVIEDDNTINQMINESLGKQGYEVVSAFSGTEGVLHIKSGEFDVVILDLMLPGMSGNNVLKEIRKITDTPVIVLSAKDELDTKIDILNAGANDYMTKPFELKELEARILVQLRQSNILKGRDSLRYKELVLYEDSKKVTVNNKPISLTVQEFKILELLLKQPQKVFTKNEIYRYAWDDYYMGEDKTINVHISNIRHKIKEITEDEYIETVWGLGFKIAE